MISSRLSARIKEETTIAEDASSWPSPHAVPCRADACDGALRRNEPRLASALPVQTDIGHTDVALVGERVPQRRQSPSGETDAAVTFLGFPNDWREVVGAYPIERWIGAGFSQRKPSSIIA
jgi:hypothetical protein